MKLATEWIDDLDGADGSATFPLIDAYLRRSDLDASTIGGGVGGPAGIYGPKVVTLLLEMTQRSVPGARARLERCLTAASPDVRMFAALALAAYDKPRAIETLAREANDPEAWHRGRASEFLLQLGDRRGIPARLEAWDSGQEAMRLFACRDLRVYSQLPLPCDASAAAAERALQASAWRAWWNENGATFRVRSRAAELDLQAFPAITPVSFGGRPVR
jgi:HEAT repeat protein